MADWRDARLVVLELLLKLGLAALLLSPSVDGLFLSLHYLTSAIFVGAVSSTIRLSSDLLNFDASSDTAKICFFV